MGASYDQKDALGFINLIGLPMKVRALAAQANNGSRGGQFDAETQRRGDDGQYAWSFVEPAFQAAMPAFVPASAGVRKPAGQPGSLLHAKPSASLRLCVKGVSR